MNIMGNMLKLKLILAFAFAAFCGFSAVAEDATLSKFFPLHAQNYMAGGKNFPSLPATQPSRVSQNAKVPDAIAFQPRVVSLNTNGNYSGQPQEQQVSNTTPTGFYALKRYQPRQRALPSVGTNGYYRAPSVVKSSFSPVARPVALTPNTSKELSSNAPYNPNFYGSSEIGITAHTWPVDLRANQRISSGFGFRKHPVTGRGALHNGVDIAAATGTPVVASADGIVEETGQDNLIGKFVKLRHPDGSQSLYGHLSRVDVQEAAWLKRYQPLGAVGSTGRTTGPHLHYALNLDGKAMDPMTYLTKPSPQMASR